jgi:Fe-S-cluster containining protein
MEEQFEMHKRAPNDGFNEEEWSLLGDDTRWECIRCSRCCRRPWSVNLTWWEYERLKNDPRAAELKIDKVEVDPVTEQTHPYFVISKKCPILKDEGAVCRLYPDWLYTCATYPFLLLRDGSIFTHKICPGFGHGKIIDPEEMRNKIIAQRKRAGMIVDEQ